MAEKNKSTVGFSTPSLSIKKRIVSKVASIIRKLKNNRRLSLSLGLAVLVGIVGGSILLPRILDKPAALPSNVNDELAYRQYLIESKDYKPTYTDYLILGNEYFSKKDYKSAEKNYLKAESMNSDIPDTLYSLATIYRLQKKSDLALKYYDKVIALESKNDQSKSSVEIYKAERASVAKGDFDLVNSGGVKHDIPL